MSGENSVFDLKNLQCRNTFFQIAAYPPLLCRNLIVQMRAPYTAPKIHHLNKAKIAIFDV